MENYQVKALVDHDADNEFASPTCRAAEGDAAAMWRLNAEIERAKAGRDSWADIPASSAATGTTVGVQSCQTGTSKLDEKGKFHQINGRTLQPVTQVTN
jgi:hypothetical protein